MNRQGQVVRLVGSAALLMAAQSIHAAGFYLPEVGTPVSVGTAGVANPTNTYTADAAWTNPAGMTGMTEDSMLAGMMVSYPTAEFDSKVATAGGKDGGNAAQGGAIPSFFYNKVLSEKSRVGFSMVVPFGGGFDYGDNFVGRYSIQSVSLAGLAFTPAYAYKVNDQLSLGIGVSFIYTTLEQDIALRRLLPNQPDGKAKFEDLNDWGYQGIVGLTYQVSTATLIGAVYRSKADVNLDGKLKVQGLLVPIKNQDARIDWTNPQTLEVGVRHQLNDKQTLFFNLGWQDWSEFSKNELHVTNPSGTTVVKDVTDRHWDDTWNAGVGYAQKLGAGNYYTLGLAYESSPVKDKYRTFDFPVDTLWKVAGSYGWEGSKKLSYAIGATYYMFGDGKIDQTDQGVRVTGQYDTNTSLLIGGTLRYVF